MLKSNILVASASCVDHADFGERIVSCTTPHWQD